MLEIKINEAENAARILVIGVGGAGNNAVNRMVEENIMNKDKTKTQRQLEIDFVCNLVSKRLYIQSALSLPDKEKLQQEDSSLVCEWNNLCFDNGKKIRLESDKNIYTFKGINAFGFALLESKNQNRILIPGQDSFIK